jgi:beta-lactamase regulating signal transducer with metallopeptidase domain
MNLLNDWISEKLLYAIGWALVHSIWQLVVIASLLWMLLKVFNNQRSSVKHTFGMVALGISVLFSCGTFLYELSIFHPTELAERVDLSKITLQQLNVPAYLDEPSLWSTAFNWIELQLPLLVNFWFFGAMLFLFRLFNSLSEIRILRKTSSESADFEVEKSFYKLMGKMEISKKVSLRLSSIGSSPITFGFFKPVIIIPAALIFQLSTTQLEAIIAHELAHVKRNDYLANLFQTMLEVLFFYHPCYWWINQTVKELRENAADDLAVSVGIVPKELAFGLAEVINFAQQNPPQLALAAGEKRNPTLQRIKRILGHPAQTYPQNSIISIPMLLILLLSAGLMASAQQDVQNLAIDARPMMEDLEQIEMPEPLLNDTIIKQSERHVITNTEGDQTIHYQMRGDTLIMDGDTVVLTDKNRHLFEVPPDLDLGNTPELELPETPVFPEEFGQIPPFPEGYLIEMPEFPMDAMPPIDPFIFPTDSINQGMFFFPDTINMTNSEKDTWVKNFEKQSEEWAKKSEEWAAKWTDQEGDFQLKMEEWEKKMGPKMKQFETKMQEWQKAQEPKMKEFEAKMKAWEKDNQPKIEEFQRKMDIWQKENAIKMVEFQKKLKEQLKTLKSESDN